MGVLVNRIPGKSIGTILAICPLALFIRHKLSARPQVGIILECVVRWCKEFCRVFVTSTCHLASIVLAI